MIRLKHKIVLFILLVALAVNNIQSEAVNTINVSTVLYRIDKEWATLWINEDLSVELHYNITITYESSAQGYITIGLPARNFNVISVKNPSGKSLSYEDVSFGDEYAVEAFFGHSMKPGDSDTILFIATVPYDPNDDFIGEDDFNPGHLGLEFMPTTFDAKIVNLRVAIVPPKGVTQDNIKTSETAYFTVVDGDFALYWERDNLSPNTQVIFGVSIPEQFFTLPSSGPDIWFYLTIFLVMVSILSVVIVYLRRRKETYEKPKIRIEALGPARGLTAVEAAVVVDLKPVRVLTMILFGLLLKRFIMIKETEPLIKVERLPKSDEARHPRYYEIDFLDAIESDGALNEQRMARNYLSLRKNVDVKMRGYARTDTVKYYKSIVENAWKQVKRANTPKLAEDVLEKNLEWLLMDDKYEERFKTAFPRDVMIIPRPYWYWYGPHFPSKGTPASTQTETKPIPVQEFADKIVTGFERAAGGLVKNAEDFAKRLVPPKATTRSSKPIRHRASCVCACASCACACACVSCACACAGGGAR